MTNTVRLVILLFFGPWVFTRSLVVHASEISSSERDAGKTLAISDVRENFYWAELHKATREKEEDNSLVDRKKRLAATRMAASVFAKASDHRELLHDLADWKHTYSIWKEALFASWNTQKTSYQGELANSIPNEPTPHLADGRRAALYSRVLVWEKKEVALSEIALYRSDYCAFWGLPLDLIAIYRSPVELSNVLPNKKVSLAGQVELSSKLHDLYEALKTYIRSAYALTPEEFALPILIAANCYAGLPDDFRGKLGVFALDRKDLKFGADDGNFRLMAQAAMGKTEAMAIVGSCEQPQK